MPQGTGCIKNVPWIYMLWGMVTGLTALLGTGGCADGNGVNSARSTAYHSYEQIDKEFHEIAAQYHDIAKLFSIGETMEGRRIWAMKISKNVSADESEPAVLIIGGQHAREWISVEVPLQLAKYLTAHYGSDHEATRIVNNTEVWIVPMVNPDGHEYSRTANRLWRKNRRDNGDRTFGVDLNRNYGYMWGQGGSASGEPHADFYQGPKAFSEPETQALRDLVMSRDFKMIIDYHSYAQSVLYPSDSLQMRDRAQVAAALIRGVHGKMYSALPYERPLFSGGFVDWAYGVAQVDAYLIELRPDSASNSAEYPWLLRRTAFEPPDFEIAPTWEEQRPALIFLIKTYGLLD